MSDREVSPAAPFLEKQKQKAAANADNVPDSGKPPPMYPFDSEEEDLINTPAKSEHSKTVAQVWQTHETGADAIAALQAESPETSFSSILLGLSALLPVSIFAYHHAKWKSTPITSLTVFVAVFKVALPDIYSSVFACTALSGPTARAAIDVAVSQMFGAFGDTVHSAFIYAVMVSVWASQDSPYSTLICDLMVAYMEVSDSDLSQFLTG